jgi:hypothetical protein
MTKKEQNLHYCLRRIIRDRGLVNKSLYIEIKERDHTINVLTRYMNGCNKVIVIGTCGYIIFVCYYLNNFLKLFA